MKDCRILFGGERAGSFWDEHELSFGEVTAVGRIQCSVNHRDDGKFFRVRVGDQLAGLEGFAVGFEILTGRERVTLRLIHRWFEVVEVNAGKRLRDMEFARFAVESAAIPIEDTVGGVGVLLDFVNQESGADRVEAAGGNEDRVTGLGAYRMHAVGDRAVGDGRFKIFAGHAVFETDIKFRAFVAIGDEPHFRFRLAIQRCGKRDGWVHLDRKIVAGIENFDEDRKARVLRVSASENFLAVMRPKFVQTFAGKGTGFDDRLLLLAVDDFPGLAVGTVLIGKLAAVDALEFASAPDALHVEGGESDRIHGAATLTEAARLGKARLGAIVRLTSWGGEVKLLANWRK